MTMLTVELVTLILRNPFRLSYGVSDTRDAYWIRLKDDEGWGEGTIPPYYHINAKELTQFWAEAAKNKRPLPDDPAEIPGWIGPGGPAPARCALELALFDRIGRLRGVPLYQLLGFPEPSPQPTSFTIALDTPEAMAQMALQSLDYPVIKVKLGSEDDNARLAAIRAVRADARLRIDANAGWTRDEALHYVHELEKYHLEMIEQPLVKNDIEGLGLIQKTTDIPIVADEFIQSVEDVARLVDAGVKGINLKLMKIGGITPAIQALHLAKECGLKVMLGCMIETSIGTTAMAHFAGLADWFDLDAPLLVKNDPFDGIKYDSHLDFTLPDRPGIGVIRKTAI